MITLNVNRLNALIKKVAGWIKKKKKKNLKYTACKRLMSGWKTPTDWKWRKKIFCADGSDKKEEVAAPVSDKGH